MGFSMNNILYISLAGLAVTMLYLLVQLKRVQKEVEASHKTLDSKCNRLNTMIQSYTVESSPDNLSRGEIEGLPDTLNVEEELKKEIEALEQKELSEEALEHEEANRELETLEDSLNEASNETSADNKGLFSDIPFELEMYQDKNLAAMEDEPEEETEVVVESVETQEVVEENTEGNEEAALEEVSLESEVEEPVEKEEDTLQEVTLETKAEQNNIEELSMSVENNINYYDLTVKELKQIAGNMNLKVGGTKPELVSRIENAVRQ